MISVCAISGNEEKYFRPWVEHLKKVSSISEINVLYNGDKPERLVDVNYQESNIHYNFSEWRNRSIEMATKDWILVLDIDEFLSYEFINDLPRLLSSGSEIIKARRIDFWNKDAYRLDLKHQKYYLFKNESCYFYTRPLHEELCVRHGDNIEDIHSVRLMENEMKICYTDKPVYHYSFIKRQDEGADRIVLYRTIRYVNNWEYGGDDMNKFSREDLVEHIKKESEKGLKLSKFEGKHPIELEGII